MSEDPKWQKADIDFDEMTRPLRKTKEMLQILKKDLVRRKASIEKAKRRLNKGKK